MSDNLTKQLKTIAIAAGLIALIAGWYSTIVLAKNDVTVSKAVNEKQDIDIKANAASVTKLDTEMQVHEKEAEQRDKHLDSLQTQFDENMREQRTIYRDIRDRLPPKN